MVVLVTTPTWLAEMTLVFSSEVNGLHMDMCRRNGAPTRYLGSSWASRSGLGLIETTIRMLPGPLISAVCC